MDKLGEGPNKRVSVIKIYFLSFLKKLLQPPLKYDPLADLSSLFSGCLKHFCNSSNLISYSAHYGPVLIAHLFKFFFTLGNQKKSHGARFGEYSSCGSTDHPSMARQQFTRHFLLELVNFLGFRPASPVAHFFLRYVAFPPSKCGNFCMFGI